MLKKYMAILTSYLNCREIKILSIDYYQGEENDITFL
ncbi:unnamed protein product [Paramecium sonneborni]|uniref:Uncharacterized protein n=1 Tax=Paramecium sonneborni TaxID=65129 RepID=A0A8S1NMP8_9CILI|nr:unnamed protein product [Paramecium sonneborni]